MDALLQIGDFGVFDVPYFLYQDSNVDVLEDLIGTWPSGIPGLPHLDLSSLRRRRRRQQEIYDGCERVFAMSLWFKRVLVERSGVAPERVTVVRAGAHALPLEATTRPVGGRRSRLLFVGREFWRKGGDLVVDAVGILRRRRPDLTLTIAGPPSWPLPGAIPPGITFEGPVSLERVSALMSSHDLFVMPSRFEAFGIALVEALTYGLPCVARNAYAMTEIIAAGRNGALIDDDDVEALCTAIESILDSDAIYTSTWESRRATAEHYSWDRTADTMAIEIIRAVGG